MVFEDAFLFAQTEQPQLGRVDWAWRFGCQFGELVVVWRATSFAGSPGCFSGVLALLTLVMASLTPTSST